MNAKLLEERTVFHIGTPARVERVRLAPDWGVANLIIPGAIIPFCIFHPKEAKRPMILAVVCLVVFIILWVYARHGSHARPRIDVAPAVPA
jgi:hypothetical protein